jgi:hypothetical protein
VVVVVVVVVDGDGDDSHDEMFDHVAVADYD